MSTRDVKRPTMRRPEKNAARTDAWVRPYLRKYRKQLLQAIGLGVISFICAALMMFASGYLISRAADPEILFVYLTLPIGLVQIFGVGKPVAHYFERLTSHDWVFRMTSNLRLRLYRAIERDSSTVQGRRTGEFLGLLSEDIGHLQNLFLRVIFPTVVVYALCVVVAIALSFFSLWFALVTALIMAITVVVLPYASLQVNRARTAHAKALTNQMYAELTDNVLGSTDWVFSGRGGEYISKQMLDEDALRQIQMQLRSYQRANSLVVNVMLGIGVCITLIWAAGYFGGADVVSASWIAAFVLAFFPLIEAFAPMSEVPTLVGNYSDSIERLNDYPQVDDGAASDGQVQEALSRVEGFSIDVVGVNFTYPGTQRRVLDGLDLHITQGQRVAILGRSGSGKSTLASLIRGDIAPDEGSISIGGVSVSELGEGIPKLVGVVQQQAYIFNRTLRDNLTLGNPGAGDDMIWDVLEQVRLAGMVRALPQGLDTMVDEAGMRFSGGERHRIALARVLLSEVPIILLDEPTVGLDPATEHALLETLFETTRGKTLVMITHHLQDIHRFDRVVFIEDGRADMDGAPDELARTSERYQQLLSFDKGI